MNIPCETLEEELLGVVKRCLDANKIVTIELAAAPNGGLYTHVHVVQSEVPLPPIIFMDCEP